MAIARATSIASRIAPASPPTTALALTCGIGQSELSASYRRKLIRASEIAVLDKSFLVRVFGYRASFFHGDPMMLDRWRFVARHLPRTRNGERLIDVGCGSGAFTIGAAKRGYAATGLSWDHRNQQVAQQRAAMVGVGATEFPIGDARQLDAMTEFKGRFDVVLSLENIEHIIDDRKLMRDLAACLKPGGRLLLTTPNYEYRAVTPEDDGPFAVEESGWHVRRGYSPVMLRELANDSGLMVDKLGSCSGLFSQKLTWLTRRLGWLGWGIGIPLRILPPILDRFLRRLTGYPDFSLTLVAYKPRFIEQ